ncbi:MAG: hypothetical protein ACFFAH_08140 [Promethearchaeota archaeon]
MFYQQNPVYSIVIVLLFLGLYLLFKARKRKHLYGRSGFFKGGTNTQNRYVNDLITLVLAQNFIGTSFKDISDDIEPYQDDVDEREAYIEKTKREIIDLLEN